MVGWNSVVAGACGTGGSSLHDRQEEEGKGLRIRDYLPRHCPVIAFRIAPPTGAVHIQTIQLTLRDSLVLQNHIA